MTSIVVGFDGSDGARHALEWAVAETTLRGAALAVVTVVPISVTLGSALAPVAETADEESLRAADEATRAAVEKATVGRDLPVSVRAIRGVPSEELLKAAEGADLLVVGTRGRGGFARLLLGSVSTQVAHHATCPTVIIPAG